MHSYVSGKILCEEGVWLQGLGNVLETPLFATSHPSYQSACFLLTSLCIMAGKETFFGEHSVLQGLLAWLCLELPLGLEAAELW